MAQYFRKHFYFGTEINGINVSGKTLVNAKAVMAAKLNTYTLNIQERGGKIEQITAHDVGLKYSSDEELKKLLDYQNGFKWVSECVAAKDSKKTVVLTYDENMLNERINQLSCFRPENIVEPKNPSFKYIGEGESYEVEPQNTGYKYLSKSNEILDGIIGNKNQLFCFKPGNIAEPKNPSFKYVDEGYVIVDGVIGNKVDKDILYSDVIDSIFNMQAVLDLELMGCYIKPQYDSKSEKVLEVKDTLNKYIATKITYTFEDNKKTLDGSLINQWLTVDENLKVIVNEEKVRDYINEIADTYNTVGKTRNFITSSGETISISGGDYGRSVNKVEETQYLMSAIEKGQTITKEPIFDQNAFINDIGNTYVEISIAKQHLWFYKNGSLIVQGDVVTGNVSQGHSTHKGIYSLKGKSRNAVLRGPGYAAPVDFWMPFDGGIGIHDASWRSVFGGSIYITSGSHGCVNSPYNVAQTIFNNITPGTPVICY
jgi:hypothetical protein